MITNEKQFRTTRLLVERLQESLKKLDASSDVHPIFVNAQRSALTNQISELLKEVSDYEELQSGRLRVFEAEGLHDVPEILIRARIARGMSQRELADFLGLKEQQIQRYESERYRSASLERLVEVADALDVRIVERAELAGDGRLGEVDPLAWPAFPVAEMYKRGWFEDFSGSLPDARKAAAELVPAFFLAARAQWAPSALHRKSMRVSKQMHEPAVAAWEARVLTLADKYPPSVSFRRDQVKSDWVRDLVKLSAKDDGLLSVSDHLRSIGIALVIEPQLPGTLLDGAALRSARDIAVIALTLRHDRLDNFWFTLLHEVGHLALHVHGTLSAVFDETETPADSTLEKEADYFAQEALLPTHLWHSCMSRFTRSERAVLSDAEKFKISPAIIAGRIRREAGDYKILNNLVGFGEVRKRLMH